MKFMSASLKFCKKILTLSFWIPSDKACILCQATKRISFIFMKERNFIMRTTKNWVMRHLPYIGTAILLCGIFCLIAKALSPEYLDAEGYLHENFFLLPIGFALLFAAILLFLGAGIHFLVGRKNHAK